MNNISVNWKTTLAGIGVIVPAIWDIVTAVVLKQPPHFEADFSAIIAGIGLIFAKDASVTGVSK
jgi:hypothetical protein